MEDTRKSVEQPSFKPFSLFPNSLYRFLKKLGSVNLFHIFIRFWSNLQQELSAAAVAKDFQERGGRCYSQTSSLCNFKWRLPSFGRRFPVLTLFVFLAGSRRRSQPPTPSYLSTTVRLTVSPSSVRGARSPATRTTPPSQLRSWQVKIQLALPEHRSLDRRKYRFLIIDFVVYIFFIKEKKLDQL